jgi:hypothetical protein
VRLLAYRSEWFWSPVIHNNSTQNLKRQAMYAARKGEACSPNHCCCGKARSTLLSILSVCSLSYPARNAHAPYCHPWHVWLYNIFPHSLINGTTFGKKLLNIKCVFWFYLQLLSETFLILRRIQRHSTISVHRSSCKVPVILVTFNETSIFLTDFRKILTYQISWKSVQWELTCSMRTDRQTWRN